MSTPCNTPNRGELPYNAEYSHTKYTGDVGYVDTYYVSPKFSRNLTRYDVYPSGCAYRVASIH